jgi:DNA-directed RNA polymerase subunit RPC12/RpoP
MDPGLIDFLLGAGIGFIEDDIIICPHCGCEFPEEDLRYVDASYVCPACLKRLEGHEDDEDDEG